MVTELIDGYRMSPQQRRVWRWQQLGGGGPYRTQCAILLEGPLDRGVLRATLADLLARHEILRTDFRHVPGISFPLQVVNPEAVPSIDEHDLTGLGRGEEAARLDQQFRGMLRRPLDCEGGTPLRASLSVLSGQKHALLVSLPALCADHASLENIARELARAYAARTGRGEPGEEPIQYIEVSEVFLDLLESEETEAGRDYWRGLELPDPRTLKLPLEAEPGAAVAFAPEVINFRLDGRLLSRLEEAAGERGTTPRVFLFACWRLLLGRLTGQSDFAVGFASDGRTHEDLREALGLFERYLPVRCRVDDSARFEVLLEELERQTSEALDHQDYFDWSQVEGFDAGGGKLPPSPFAFDFDAPSETHPAGELRLRVVRQYSCSERFRLKLWARPSGGGDGLSLGLHYDAAVYARRHAADLARHYLTLLSASADAPAARAASLPLLDARQRRRLLRRSRTTHATPPAARPFHELFSVQAARTPEAVAVRDEAGQITYAELDRRSNQLARHLRRLGVGPERAVALYLRRGPRMVEAILGVWKAGGAYLPLDTASPAERLRLMVEDAGALAVLAESGREEALAEVGVPVVGLEAEGESIAREPAEPFASGVTSENLAYVIYTSGSTGRPKGVTAEHRSLVNYLGWVNGVLLGGEVRNLPVVTSLNFDMCLKQLLAPLLAGNEVWLLPDEIIARPTELLRALTTRPRFGLNCVPSLWKGLLDSLGAAESEALGSGLACLAFGGERLSESLAERSFEIAPGVQLWNIYGPTEVTANATGTVVRPGDGVTIGRPISHVQAYVLDEYLNPVPFGIAGELCVGGSGVTRGYRSRPDLTAERFIPDPFGGEAGARLYRTGDRVRLLPDGRLDFVGRIDHQVKVRGYRIEPGEVESALGRHAGVREAVVVAREEEAGDARLVAYVTPAGAPPAAELREHLQSVLPAYMVPAAFVALDALPLTPNGKVDRRALPAPESARTAESEVVAPRTPAERLLAEVWAEVLGLELSELGVNDNFFELGGDSILGIKVIARANAAGLALATGQLFRYQTISELSAVAGTNRLVRASQGVVTGAAPLTPIQHWFFRKRLPEPNHFNQSLMLEVRQALDPSAMKEAVRHLLLHHDALRLRFTHAGSAWRQHVVPPSEDVPFEVVDVSGRSGSELRQAIEAAAAAAQASLNITDGPLVRVLFFDAGAGEAPRLLIAVHHLSMDIVSWGPLLEDLYEAYAQLGRGEAVRLPAKTTSYKEWAERLQAYADSAELRREAAHWLSPAYRSVARLPVDDPDAANEVASSRTLRVSLDEEETQALLREIPKAHRVQIHEVLVTALAQALSSWAGGGAVLLNLEGHGREEVFDGFDLSRTVGWFTAIYPVLLDLTGAEGPLETLQAVKERLRRTPNGGLGYGVLRYLCGDAELRGQLEALPLPQVIFNYQGQGHSRQQAADSPFRVAKESAGPDADPRGTRHHLLDVNGGVVNERLVVHFTYSENVHRRSTVEGLADRFIEGLRDLIANCRDGRAPAQPAADFPQAGLDEHTLEKIMAKVRFD
ncbi:MAG: amino acid adenylation domain-containing protein [Pyrinomonadaceae bacterium]